MRISIGMGLGVAILPELHKPKLNDVKPTSILCLAGRC